MSVNLTGPVDLAHARLRPTVRPAPPAHWAYLAQHSGPAARQAAPSAARAGHDPGSSGRTCRLGNVIGGGNQQGRRHCPAASNCLVASNRRACRSRVQIPARRQQEKGAVAAAPGRSPARRPGGTRRCRRDPAGGSGRPSWPGCSCGGCLAQPARGPARSRKRYRRPQPAPAPAEVAAPVVEPGVAALAGGSGRGRFPVAPAEPSLAAPVESLRPQRAGRAWCACRACARSTCVDGSACGAG